MGQLEKYGLYVLCLVIFLILGVTVWGGGDLPPSSKGSAAAIKAAASGMPESPAAGRDRDAGGIPNFDALLRSAERGTPGPADPKKVGPGAGTVSPTPGPKDAEPREASAGRGNDPPKTAPSNAPRPTHKVRNKDTFEGIAKEVLGNAALRTEIARLNDKVDPTKLKPGQELLLPTPAEIAQWSASRRSDAPPGPGQASKAKEGAVRTEAGTYTVAKGDTFGSIAAAQLGSARRVNELLELNPTLDPTSLKPGQKIKLPKK